MEPLQNLIINTCFGFFFGIMIYFKYQGILISKLDHILAALAILISIIILFFRSIQALDFAHFLYCLIYLFTVSFLSNNVYLLGLNVIMITVILATRYYYQHCLINKKHESKGFFADINSLVIKNLKFWNWDYIFPILLVVSIYQLINYISIK